jgi:hypothetical protein
LIECPQCGGDPDGCEHCRDGYFELASCPQKEIPPELREEIRLAVWVMEKSILPEPGGMLDQDARFYELLNYFQAEVTRSDDERLRNHGG